MSKNVRQITEELVLPILLEKGLELVDIEFKKEGSQWFLRIFIDKPSGVDIEDCEVVSEALSVKLDERDPIPQAYFLEVSSPGAERVLKKEKEIEAAIGQAVHATLYEPLEGSKEYEGRLIQFDGEFLIIEIQVKTRKQEITIPYNKVAQLRLAVVF